MSLGHYTVPAHWNNTEACSLIQHNHSEIMWPLFLT